MIRACAGALAFRVLAMIAFAWPQPGASAESAPAVSLLGDFEGPAALQNWRFDSSPEPLTAAGGLTLGPGHRGQGALLTYSLSCDRDSRCSAYAEALWRPASPLPVSRNPAISLWIRFPPEASIFLVVKDASGQTLRFPIQATIEHPKAGSWQYAEIPLSTKSSGEGSAFAGRIKGRLVEAGILVEDRARIAIKGSVSFDDVLLRELSETFHIDAAAPAERPVPEQLELAPRLGVNIHVLRDDGALDLARAAGFKFVRMDMAWANVERDGRYRFRAYDALLRALDARGMGVLWILDYGHPDHGGGPPRTPQDLAAFGRFAEAVAAHFKGRNVRYEIWNEPNLSRFWPPFPNASEYAALLREAIAAIHRADPSAKVSSGGVARIDEGFLSRALDPSLAAGLTAIAIHPYRETGPETIALELAALREWAARVFGDRMEIWDTEWGYSSADSVNDSPSNGHSSAARRRQAALAVREILTVWTAGFPVAVWYDLRDDGPGPADPEHNYGLLDSSGNEKPAMKALRTLMGTIGGRKYAGMIQEMPAGLHAMRLNGPADTVLIVWTSQPGGRQTVEYTKQGLRSATDLMGKPLKPKNSGSGQARIKIDEAAGPVYLIWTAESRDVLHSRSRRPTGLVAISNRSVSRFPCPHENCP